MVATFALHAQEVNDSINNNASNGRVMYFTGEVNCEWNTLGNWRSIEKKEEGLIYRSYDNQKRVCHRGAPSFGWKCLNLS